MEVGITLLIQLIACVIVQVKVAYFSQTMCSVNNTETLYRALI
jgi:hypothetical protein